MFHGSVSEVLALEDVGTLSPKAGRRWFLYLSEQCQPYQLERAALRGRQENLSLWPCVRQSSHPLYYHCCFLFLAVCDSFGLSFESRAGGGSWGTYSKIHTFRKL